MELKQFIDRSNIVHSNAYRYDDIPCDIAITRHSTCIVPIRCPTHGIFNQRVTDHLRGRGCKQCANRSASNKALSWLEHISSTQNIQIQHAANIGEYFVPQIKSFVDGYCFTNNTIYEFDGDAFHGNPSRYKPLDLCHPFDKTKTAGELYAATLQRQQALRALGYSVIAIWESEFDKLGIEVVSFPSVVRSRKHTNYPDLLKSMGLEIQGEYTGSKNKHIIRCLVCGELHEATPVSKQWCKKRHPSNYGCPLCNKRTTDNKNKAHGNYIERLKRLNFSVVDYINARTKCTLICTKCNTAKIVTPSAIIQHNKPCCT